MNLSSASRRSDRIEIKRPALYILLSFFLPMLIITAALAGLKVAPFGDRTLVISDGNTLYINYLSYVGRAVRGLEGFTYSFEKGLGGNMMGSWGWFLLNPTFALFALFDIADYPTAYTVVSTLNLCLCGLTMYLLLAGLYGHKPDHLIFSTAYALCGFNVANVFQMNFFIGVTVLPLMVLGLVRIFQDRSPLLYILSLGYALLMNFYFGFMLCVASVLFFCAAWIADGKSVDNKKRVVLKYFLSSLLAGVLSAVIWLPALLSLRGGRLDQTTLTAYSFTEKMPFLEMGVKLFSGANDWSELVDGLPNIFVGLFPVALAILFFLDKGIDKRKKAAAGFLLGVYAACFYVIIFDIFMHGGTTTNWFNFRYSFVFSFLLLFIAAFEWAQFTSAPISNLKRMAAILLLGTAAVFSKKYAFADGSSALLDLAVLALIFLALWMHRRNPQKNPAHVFLLVVLLLTSFNLFLNYEFSTRKILQYGTTVSDYREVVNHVDTLVQGVKEGDEGFFRMEVNEQRSHTCGNDSMLYGYNGVGHGGSDERNFVRTGLNKLGVHRYDMRNYYWEGVPAATDTLLGIRYVIARDDLTEEKGYEQIIQFGEWSLYRNSNALPIAFLSTPGIGDAEIDLENVFANLNTVWMALSGRGETVFVEENEVSFTPHHRFSAGTIAGGEAAVKLRERDGVLDEGLSDKTSVSNAFEVLREPPTDAAYIEYTWTASQDGVAYIYNRAGVANSGGASAPMLACLGYIYTGDTVTGYLPIKDDAISTYILEEVAGRFRAAYADADALAEMSELVRSRPTTIEKVTESHLRGEFTSNGEQLLMFTIPWDEGWTLWVDGEKTEIRKALDLFMAAEAPAGTHTYELRFVPAGLKPGAAAAAAGLVALLVFLLIDRGQRKRRKAVQAEAPSPETQETEIPPLSEET